MMKHTILLLLFMLAGTVLRAEIQKTPRLGKISIEEMEASICPIDSSAPGYYLFDKGSTDFVYRQTTVRSDDPESSKGFQLVFKRHLRIKILDKSASDYGDFEIPLYHKGTDEEKASNIKGFTFNLEDGKITKTKLDTRQIIYEKKTDNITVVKIAMPEVREGSVIDLEYEVLSDFLFNLQEWYFQKQLPVLYSEYRVAIPQYFFYKPSSFGYHRFDHKISSQSQTIKLVYIQRAEGLNTKEQRYEHEEKYQDKITTFFASNVPAFKAERFLKAQKNYLTRIAFELEGTQFPNSGYKNFSSSWKEVAEELLKHESFGKALERNGFLDEAVQSIEAVATTKQEKILAAYNLVQNSVKWNGKVRLFTESPLKKVWEDGQGNSAELNLSLVALLKRLDVAAYPVVLSTQNNGILPLTHPSISDLNYVIAMTEEDNTLLLMDATEPNSYPNLLPERCLNGNGQIISDSRFGEVEIAATQAHQTYIKTSLELKDDGTFEGTVELNEAGYAALERRKQYYQEDDSLLFTQQLEKDFSGLSITHHSTSNLENKQDPLIDSMLVVIKDQCDLMGDMLAFSPLLAFKTNENPFKLDQRDYPIEFSFPLRQTILCSIKIPEDYQIESLPDPIRAAMPNKDMEVTFTTSAIGNIIQVVSDFKINKSMFLPAEYEAVKNTFSFLINKHNEKVVLKKI
ncbi:DUF3857 domain-containing protein [Geofilum rhodophaeum]|uniref:DUF3857 domain-containing protein n=1 Tax=Geofilum rhodophaeum TaxID=1965019 RepID=UPI000B524BF7|nr:DUF3857 domain-containing protein [Geofilum rhodophaeum]